MFLLLVFSFEKATYEKIRVFERWESVATKPVTDSILLAV